ELLLPLLSGGCSQLLDAALVKDLDALVERTRTVTVLHAVPSLMERWCERLGPLGAQTYPNLRTLLVGGEAVPQRLRERLSERFPWAEVVELYGPTEATVISTASEALDKRASTSIGRPL